MLSGDIGTSGWGKQVVIEGEQCQLQPIADTQLVEDVGEVALDSFFANAEGLRNVLVGRPFGDQRDHFQFARGEAKGLTRRRSGLKDVRCSNWTRFCTGRPSSQY